MKKNIQYSILSLYITKNMEYTHLHGHSTYSFLEAIGTPKEIVAKSKELWFKHMAITDFGNMYGAIAFYNAARSNDINPIIWTEIWFVLDITWYNKLEDIGNLCLLAKNSDWYNSLMKIVSHSNQEWIVWKAKCDTSMLKKYNEWLIAFMGGKESWIGKMILRSEADDKIMEIMTMIQNEIWIENTYLEIIAKDEMLDENTAKINKKILELSEKHNIKCIVDNAFQYINKEDKETWEMALAIKDGNKMYDQHRRKPKWDFHIMSGDEIVNVLLGNGYEQEQIEKRIENNNKIAEEIKIDILMWQALFPNYQTPEEMKKIYDDVKDDLISE